MFSQNYNLSVADAKSLAIFGLIVILSKSLQTFATFALKLTIQKIRTSEQVHVRSALGLTTLTINAILFIAVSSKMALTKHRKSINALPKKKAALRLPLTLTEIILCFINGTQINHRCLARLTLLKQRNLAIAM